MLSSIYKYQSHSHRKKIKHPPCSRNRKELGGSLVRFRNIIVYIPKVTEITEQWPRPFVICSLGVGLAMFDPHTKFEVSNEEMKGNAKCNKFTEFTEITTVDDHGGIRKHRLMPISPTFYNIIYYRWWLDSSSKWTEQSVNGAAVNTLCGYWIPIVNYPVIYTKNKFSSIQTISGVVTGVQTVQWTGAPELLGPPSSGPKNFTQKRIGHFWKTDK